LVSQTHFKFQIHGACYNFLIKNRYRYTLYYDTLHRPTIEYLHD